MIPENKDRKKIRYAEISLHLLIWAVIFNLPLLTSENSAHTFQDYLRMWTVPVFFVIVFYINYHILIHRFLFSGKIGGFFITNLVLFFLCSLAMEELKYLTLPPIDDNPFSKSTSPQHFYIRNFIALAMTTAVSVAIVTTKQWLRSEELRKELESDRIKSELLNLKNQLNPHFFFNTLNNIYGLIIQDPQKAQETMHQLGKLMRYLLYESNERFVPLSKEIDFTKSYVELMKLRMTPNVRVDSTFPEKSTGIAIAPLLFISLIENSFKHGVNLDKPAFIEMVMSVTESKQLTFNIKNTSFPKSDTDRSGSGIGLDNLKKRLTLLYPEKHTITFTSGGNYFECTITLDL